MKKNTRDEEKLKEKKTRKTSILEGFFVIF